MILTTQQLKENYKNFVDAKGKIKRDVRDGKLFQLVRGLYETNPNVEGFKLAQFIYGPSYLSFDYALYRYGLISEAVYNTFTCASFNKNKIKTYTNYFGTFVYRDVPKNVFRLGIIVNQENNYVYQIATPEKALCDKLYITSPIKNLKSLKELLFADLRIDEDSFKKLNKQDILSLAPLYHSANLNLLVKYLKGDE